MQESSLGSFENKTTLRFAHARKKSSKRDGGKEIASAAKSSTPACRKQHISEKLTHAHGAKPQATQQKNATKIPAKRNIDIHASTQLWLSLLLLLFFHLYFLCCLPPFPLPQPLSLSHLVAKHAQSPKEDVHEMPLLVGHLKPEPLPNGNVPVISKFLVERALFVGSGVQGEGIEDVIGATGMKRVGKECRETRARNVRQRHCLQLSSNTHPHFTYLDHCGGGLVVFGSSVLVDSHGDELYRLGIHFGSHVVVLSLRPGTKMGKGVVRGTLRV